MEGYLELIVRAVVLGAALVVPMQLAKRPLSRLLKREPDPWEVRGVALLLGLLVGLFPGAFPRELEMAWRGILGAASGAACTTGYAVWRARLRGQAPAAVGGKGEGGGA